MAPNPPRPRRRDAGPAARRSPSPGSGGLPPPVAAFGGAAASTGDAAPSGGVLPSGDSRPSGGAAATPGGASASGGGTSTPTHASAASAARARRRRFRPSALRVFLGASAVLAAVFDLAAIVRRARRGPWRAEVAEGSMTPALLPGDWLLLDPTLRRWPRPGAIVVVREPATGLLAIKRVAARGRRGGAAAAVVTLADGSALALESRAAWVLGDAADGSIDSRSYGPLDADALVARAWFRYGPWRRIGRLR